jgi:hypothetical protein
VIAAVRDMITTAEEVIGTVVTKININSEVYTEQTFLA